jgi:thymidylate synthase (FAD)
MNVKLVALTRPHLEGVSIEDFTAYIARIGKVKDNPKKLIKYLIKNKHWSPFEHTYITFKIETSRAIGRQLLRHRSFTFQELSQRYEEVLEFEKIELRREHPTNRQSSTEVFNPTFTNEDFYCIPEDMEWEGSELIKEYLYQVEALYTALLEAGVAKECARMILPECAKTTMLMTGNLRSWIHFLEIRLDEHAQKEVREVSESIKKELLVFFSETFNIQNE